MEANFVSFLARNRCKPPVTRPQFRAWARALGVPIAAYDNRAWRERIPDVATHLIFGGSPRLNAGRPASPRLGRIAGFFAPLNFR